MKFTFAQKFVILIMANFLLFFAIGKIFFDKRPSVEGRLDYFLNGLENPKLPYHLNIERLSENHKYLTIEVVNSTSIIRDACYQISPDRLQFSDICKNDLKVVLDEHAASSLIVASYYPQNTLFSEFLFGHIKVSGLTFSDILAIFK